MTCQFLRIFYGPKEDHGASELGQKSPGLPTRVPPPTARPLYLGWPPPAGCQRGPGLISRGYRGLRWRNFRSRLFSGGFCIYRNFLRWFHVRGVSESSMRQGPMPRGVGAPPPSWTARDSSGPTLLLQGLLLAHKKSTKIGTTIGLCLVFLFCKTQKQRKT